MSKEIINYNKCMSIIDMKKHIELMFLELGKALLDIRENGLYTGSWESFEDYLDEMKISPSVASRLISVYKTLVLEYQFEPDLIANAGGWSNAYEIIKLSPTKEEAQQWLTESENRLPKDTKQLLRQAKSGISVDECPHSDTYLIRVCRKCGVKIREYDKTD